MYGKCKQILQNKNKLIMFKEISLCYLLEYYSIMMHSKLQLILLKNGRQGNVSETLILAKNCIMEKTHFEGLLYLNASITRKTFFKYIPVLLLEASHIIICTAILIISLHRNVNN